MTTEPEMAYVACLTVGDLMLELAKLPADAEIITTSSLLRGARVILQTTGTVLVCEPEHPVFKRERPLRSSLIEGEGE